jgi:hypothetical protein
MSTPFRRVRFTVIFLSVALLAAALLAYLISAMQPSYAEQAAATLRVGMTLEEASEASGIRFQHFNGAPVRVGNGMDASTLDVKFSEAPHRVVAVHAYRASPRRWLLTRYPIFRAFIPFPGDPAREAAVTPPPAQR